MHRLREATREIAGLAPAITGRMLRAHRRRLGTRPLPDSKSLSRGRRSWPVRAAYGAAVAALLLASPLPAGEAASDLALARERLRADDLLRHIRALSSDEFEGRAPASRGEELTVRYLVDQFQHLGLKPGHPNGGFIQEVPLMGVTTEPDVVIEASGKRLPLALPGDCIATTLRYQPEVRVTGSEMVFVGYGIVAPEYGWDDYKDVDVRGKTIVMLVNDPPIPDPANPARLDPRMFQGQAMTYYGRWTYKYEIAAAKGAAAALIIHETGPAGYPYFVLIASMTRENFDLQSANGNLDKVAVQGWLTWNKARELCALAGQDLDRLKGAALRRDFRPQPLGAQASFHLTNHLRPVVSRNVVARLEGSDPQREGECVIYSAHWDHLGKNEKLPGDQVFNGALDNASGTAGLLELAGAFSHLPTPPRRSIVFLAVTAEEKGLLGAKYYAEHPLYPLARTLANLNMDGLNCWGRTRDVEVVGFGNSTLEDILSAAAADQHRVITADSSPEKGRFFRSDHFEFAKVGVPALYLKGGIDFPGQPAGFGKRKLDEYTDRDYHKVSDEVKPDWDLNGGIEDLRLLLEVGWRVAQGEVWPEWKAGSEFKARREEMLRRARPHQP